MLFKTIRTLFCFLRFRLTLDQWSPTFLVWWLSPVGGVVAVSSRCMCTHTAPCVRAVGACALHSHKWSFAHSKGCLRSYVKCHLYEQRCLCTKVHSHEWSFVCERKHPPLSQLEHHMHVFAHVSRGPVSKRLRPGGGWRLLL